MQLFLRKFWKFWKENLLLEASKTKPLRNDPVARQTLPGGFFKKCKLSTKYLKHKLKSSIDEPDELQKENFIVKIRK